MLNFFVSVFTSRLSWCCGTASDCISSIFGTLLVGGTQRWVTPLYLPQRWNDNNEISIIILLCGNLFTITMPRQPQILYRELKFKISRFFILKLRYLIQCCSPYFTYLKKQFQEYSKYLKLTSLYPSFITENKLYAKKIKLTT